MSLHCASCRAESDVSACLTSIGSREKRGLEGSGFDIGVGALGLDWREKIRFYYYTRWCMNQNSVLKLPESFP